MSQFSKFPQDPSPKKLHPVNATGVQTVTEFYSETTGNSSVNFSNSQDWVFVGLLNTGSDTFHFRKVSVSLKKTGTPNNSAISMHLISPDNTILIRAGNLIFPTTLSTSFQDFTYTWGGVQAMKPDWRLVVTKNPSDDDINFISTENDSATTTPDFALTGSKLADPTDWTDVSNDSPVMTVDSDVP